MIKPKIVTIVQKPENNRYTKEWFDVLKSEYSDELNILGQDCDSSIDRVLKYNFFANLEGSIKYETDQINELFKLDNVRELFITDLDFPGIVSQTIPLILLKFPKIKIYSILHAGSWTNGDLFAKDIRIQFPKAKQEELAIDACSKVFVATLYHKQKICNYFPDIDPDKIIVVQNGFYFNASKLIEYKNTKKNKNILMLGRGEQLENLDLGDVEYDKHTTLIPRNEYLSLLSQYKIAIINKMDESLGYGVLESLACGVIPLVPNKFCYPEIVPAFFRYWNLTDLKNKINLILHDYELCKFEMEKMYSSLGNYINAFKEIIELIKGDRYE